MSDPEPVSDPIKMRIAHMVISDSGAGSPKIDYETSEVVVQRPFRLILTCDNGSVTLELDRAAVAELLAKVVLRHGGPGELNVTR
jgi:hypothetical protein